jgi:hypothetical protein
MTLPTAYEHSDFPMLEENVYRGMSILLLLLLIFASEVTGQLATEDSEDVQV